MTTMTLQVVTLATHWDFVEKRVIFFRKEIDKKKKPLALCKVIEISGRCTCSRGLIPTTLQQFY